MRLINYKEKSWDKAKRRGSYEVRREQAINRNKAKLKLYKSQVEEYVKNNPDHKEIIKKLQLKLNFAESVLKEY